ncbi:MAG: universal stress protein [Balneolaceae bacterium]|nr:universal stress protein [Balneolaceae bacterium]MBO6545095.1 universal stress protein [Balneolaceae bacterium]MBO6646491.1 universal stress protein [Balneolaceae bacterium]
MYSIERLLVVLDLNEHDEVVYEYVNRMSRVVTFDSILFLHVADNLDIPKQLVEKYPGLIPPIDQSIKGAIKTNIDKYEGIRNIKNIEIEILDGVKLQTISKVVRDNDIDLLVINRSDTHDSEITFLQKLARTITCSIALIPPTIPEEINNLLVPIDFSKNSYMALEYALRISADRPEMNILGLHILKMPSGYFKTGLSYDEFAEELKKNAEQELALFLKENKTDASAFKMHYRLKKSDSIPYMINRFSFSNQIDAVVMGSRGRNTLSSFVLGSITEALIDRDQYLPLIVIKNKDKNMKLWDALLEL